MAGCTGGDPGAPGSGPDRAASAGSAPTAGLVGTDGSPVEVPVPPQPTGESRDVTELGADPAPGTGDDARAIRAALAASEPGDEVVLPAGVYDLRSADPDDDGANLVLADWVQLRGAGREQTVLRTSFDGDDDAAVVRGSGVHGAVVRGLTITSEYDGALGTDPDEEEHGGGPAYGVRIGEGSRRVLVDDVAVERFWRHGITVKASREVTVRGCEVADATSVGTGGAGYGIVVEGRPGQRDPDAADDARHNVVVGNRLDGTHLRHGILLQFPTHNNLVADNTIAGGIKDAIDLHGEGEYLNEIRGNTITDVRAAAIALGNSGGAVHQHDASGEGNWVHGNRLVGNELGVLVILGTPDTVIADNDMAGGSESTAGVELRNAPRTRVEGNTIRGTAAAFWAIRLLPDSGTDGRGAGVPADIRITGNHLRGSNGIEIAAGRGLEVGRNDVAVTGSPLRVSERADVTSAR